MNVSKDIGWIRQSNLIEGVDAQREDVRCLMVWAELVRDKEWSVDTVLWLHRRILWVLNRRIAGKYRECEVRVGSTPINVRWTDVPAQMMAWVWNGKYSHERGEEWIRQDHIRFEKIHPFEDGNGRVGRMLMNWQRVRAGLPPLEVGYDERFEYYKWFKECER